MDDDEEEETGEIFNELFEFAFFFKNKLEIYKFFFLQYVSSFFFNKNKIWENFNPNSLHDVF